MAAKEARSRFTRREQWEMEDMLNRERKLDDLVARCENIYMKWLLVRGAPELKIVREAA